MLAAGSVAEHQVLTCRATRDKAQLASAPQWQVTGNFVLRCKQKDQLDQHRATDNTGVGRDEDN